MMGDMTITEFLLARIAEDQAIAEAAGPDDYWLYDLDAKDRAGVAHIARHGPTRVLAECEAKRKIVAWLGHTIENEFGWDGMDWFVLKQLASVYADHSDFDEEWRA